jgi:polyphenol oxidase
VFENRRRLAAALGLSPERVACAHQVHGSRLQTHADQNLSLPCSFAANSAAREQGKPEGEKAGEADGHVLCGPGLAALVFTADCLPVALAGPDGAAMLHCGWRGLAAGIIAAGAEAVGATAAAIGPGIGPCCYEVGPDVLSAFAPLGDGIATPAVAEERGSRAGDDRSARRQLDLAEAARRLLLAAGVERIEAAGLCTSCEPELFFSHRRDAGRTGRQGNLAWIEPGEG